MAETTEISWAHSTFNPWIGCTRVSPGCDNCYAATLMDDRYGRVKWGAGEERSPTKTWGQPLAWNRKAVASGQPWRVFCASLSDVFDKDAPPGLRAQLWRLIEDTPALTWMLLTKRIGRWEECTPHAWWEGFPPNVWMGATVVNQGEYDRDWPKLIEVPAAVRWLSCEPLLGPIDLHIRLSRDYYQAGGEPTLDWVIVGGESGRDARPMNPAWATDLRDQCARANVPFHFKQWGGTRPKTRGHLLDGVEHRAFPNLALGKGAI